jgi:1,4-dihydroxy-2-naphthoate octaprenyltransferase
VATAVLPRWRVWFLAVRPWSLTISVVPIILASALAWQDGEMSWIMAALMLLTSIFTHIGCNLTNDYFDHASGVDTRQVHGPGRMLQKGHLTANDLRNGMIASFAIALLFGAPVIAHIGWLGVVFALVGAGVAFLYTGGPFPLAYNRMGEIGVFVAMGLVMVCGAYYVHTGTFSLASVLIAISVGLYAAAILHANNVRDMEVDRAHNKLTLANSFGRAWAIREYAVFVLAPIALTILLIVLRPEYWTVIGAVATLPIASYNIRLLSYAKTPPEGSRVVASTTQLHLRYGVYVTMGLVMKGLLGL